MELLQWLFFENDTSWCRRRTRVGQDNPLLTTSVIPDHLDHGKKPGAGTGVERSHKAHDAALG